MKEQYMLLKTISTPFLNISKGKIEENSYWVEALNISVDFFSHNLIGEWFEKVEKTPLKWDWAAKEMWSKNKRSKSIFLLKKRFKNEYSVINEFAFIDEIITAVAIENYYKPCLAPLNALDYDISPREI